MKNDTGEMSQGGIKERDLSHRACRRMNNNDRTNYLKSMVSLLNEGRCVVVSVLS